jgi:3'(2'), 5'-bisphosphate nucleotidase
MEQLLELARHAALEAGKAIMEVYAQPFEVYTKDDDSPVTQADLRASNIIKEILKPTGIPFVSEEEVESGHAHGHAVADLLDDA